VLHWMLPTVKIIRQTYMRGNPSDTTQEDAEMSLTMGAFCLSSNTPYPCETFEASICGLARAASRMMQV
jgi:hypothetical protein